MGWEDRVVSMPTLTPLAAAVLRVPGRPERILEIGCGKGDGVLFLAREFPAARVRGVDRSAEAIRAARARVGLDPEGRVTFKHGGARSLPYPDGFFGLVVHSGGPLLAGELARVLQAGGCLLAIGPKRLLRPRLSRHGLRVTETGEVGGVPFQLARPGDDR
jgi:ubiquinone/menaquinone biosynthesis C-methylase UbiE